ncbi:ATP-binding cassette, subfamily C, bacteriocin exporter [Staphylococcus auricularis]|uniref:peptidase domain-containing ABC transporter n=1 Tax=Staphylococcus auricularis TaxID=29379 RepID=UPI001BCF674E|nr:peptidase domain-containing ABC transporter [Staphylococcus auricularis]
MKFIQQYDEKDCGPTCIAMLAQHFGKRVSVPRLRDLAKTDKLGTNLYGLVHAAKEIGLELTGVEVDSVAEFDNVELPVIAHIINQQGYDHFIIIEQIKNGELHVVDPAKGKYKLTEAEFLEMWTHVVVLVEKMDSFTTESSDPSYMSIFGDMFKKNYKRVFAVVITSIFINIVGIVSAFFIKYLTDDIIPSNILSRLHILGIAILLLYIINIVVTYVRYHLILNMSLSIDLDLMKRYFRHVLHLPIKFFDTRKSGEILQRFMDISKIREALSSSTVTLFVDTLMIIVGAVLLFIQSPLLFLVTLIFIPAFILCSYALKKQFTTYNLKVAENDAELSSHLIESFEGNQTIKSYQSEDDVYQKGEKKFHNLITNVAKLGKFSNIQLTFNNFLKITISLVILWFGSYLVMTDQLTLGSLLSFNTLTIYYLDPIERLINIQPTLQSSIVAARRVVEIINLDNEADTNDATADYEFNQQITLNQVDFQYNFRNTVLNHVSLTVPKGTKTAIVGESGSGKTTIGKLLNNYYQANEGTVKIDNQPINEIDLASLRQNIGYVSQDTFLFADTILNNLLHGCNAKKSMDEVAEACQLAEAYDFIESLPRQFDTMLEQGGSNLSGGQAQRVALACAFLKDPDIYIFDEATSALDSMTEYRIMNNIDRLVEQGKTVIIISHKLSTVKNADRIYTLKDGEVLEQGTHQQLIQRGGEYYQLWELQTESL